MPGRADRVAHVVQAVEHRHEVVARCRHSPRPGRPRSARGRRRRRRRHARAPSRSSRRGSPSRRSGSAGTPRAMRIVDAPCPQPTSATLRAGLELPHHAVQGGQPGSDEVGVVAGPEEALAALVDVVDVVVPADALAAPGRLGDARRVVHRAEGDLEEPGQVRGARLVGQRDGLLGRQRVARGVRVVRRRSRRPPARSATRARTAPRCPCGRRAPPASAGRHLPARGTGPGGRPSRRARC